MALGHQQRSKAEPARAQAEIDVLVVHLQILAVRTDAKEALARHQERRSEDAADAIRCALAGVVHAQQGPWHGERPRRVALAERERALAIVEIEERRTDDAGVGAARRRVDEKADALGLELRIVVEEHQERRPERERTRRAGVDAAREVPVARQRQELDVVGAGDYSATSAARSSPREHVVDDEDRWRRTPR
jgi:hypothetical protein